MKYATSGFAFLVALPMLTGSAFGSEFLENILRDAAIKNGYKPPHEINIAFDKNLSNLGRLFFESEQLSFNSDTSCITCHIDKFSSADGLPNAVGVGGHGEGLTRINSGGALVPRNTLPMWGRAARGFNAFFWDGKVEAREGRIISQFGQETPSENLLEVAIHLPFVEIREMVVDTEDVNRELKKEDVDSARKIQMELISRIKADEKLALELAEAHGIAKNDIDFQHIASAIRHFFADNFKLMQTKFSKFMTGEGSISENELQGGIIFYGKGRCSSCHSGPHFSDFDYHSIAFPQTGPGKDGFGVDYGRFNVTFKTSDLYKFRTPPLHNVEHTAPYGHSGSLYFLEEAIVAHYDPFSLMDIQNLTSRERRELYARIASTDSDQTIPSDLSKEELQNLVYFLKALSFQKNNP